MSKVAEGASVNLKVVVVNAGGRIIPNATIPPDTVVTTSVAATTGNPLAQTEDTVSAVNLTDGTFTFTAGTVDGDDSLVATGGGFTSPAFIETVVADNTPAGLQIVEA